MDYAQLFTYDPESGELKWRNRPREHFSSVRSFHVWNSTFPGKVAGYRNRRPDGEPGCILVSVNNKNIKAHRIIMSLMGVELGPDDLVDHIDMDPYNNKWVNLRKASYAQNKFNKRKHKNNTSGYKGVTWNKLNGNWNAQIGLNYRTIRLGSFDRIEDAAEAYRLGALKYHGEFARFS